MCVSSEAKVGYWSLTDTPNLSPGLVVLVLLTQRGFLVLCGGEEHEPPAKSQGYAHITPLPCLSP